MMTREKAAARIVELLEAPFLRTLLEPARLEVLRVLLVHGASDVGEIAEHLPQDRSVISRHLQTLQEVGIVRGTRDGRRHVYAIDANAFIAGLERVLGETKALAAHCCPPAEPAVRRRR
jgi:DNA-binding transcriptional ArsR family regulator